MNMMISVQLWSNFPKPAISPKFSICQYKCNIPIPFPYNNSTTASHSYCTILPSQKPILINQNQANKTAITMSSKFELVFITYPAMGHIVAMVEFAHHLINHDPRFSITILIITMPERMLVNTYIQSRAATSTSTNIRFVHLPTLETPTPDHGSQTPLCLISSSIEKHKPHVKQAITNLMATELDRRFVGLFIDMFCTSMVDVNRKTERNKHCEAREK